MGSVPVKYPGQGRVSIAITWRLITLLSYNMSTLGQNVFGGGHQPQSCCSTEGCIAQQFKREENLLQAYIKPRPFKNLSSLDVKLIIKSQGITSSVKLFHMFTTICEKEYILTSKLHVSLNNFKECPLVLCVLLIAKKLSLQYYLYL